MRIFVGCHEIANFLNLYSSAFRSIGHEVETFVFNRNAYYPANQYDTVVDEVYRKYFGFLKGTFLDEKVHRRFKKWFCWWHLRKIIQKTDVFVFIWSSLQSDNEDLKFIKKHGKKIIFINCGTDVRHTDPFVQEFKIDYELWKKDFPVDPLEKKFFYLRQMELYSDLILSLPDQSGFALKPYFHLKIPYDPGSAEFRVHDRSRPQIVHCPTRRFIKGSDLIESTLDKLKEDGVEFDYKKVVNVPNHELLKILVDSDIVVDEMLLPGPGVLGFEAMVTGCVECTRHIPNKASGWLPPVVAIDNDNIYQELKRIISDKELRKEIAIEGQKYVKEKHHPNVVAGEILAWLDKKSSPHYFPQFYLDHFIEQSQKISPELQEMSLQVLKKFGCNKSTDLNQAIARNLLPKETRLDDIPRWD